jgi:PilZ domain
MRSDSRTSISIAAAVLDDSGEVLERVEIVNISAGGARIAVEAGWNLPARFTLAIPDRDERRACIVRWRLTRAVGVCFADAAAGRPSRAPAAASVPRLLELEQEVQRLLEENRSLTRELALHEVFRFDPFERRAAGAAVEVPGLLRLPVQPGKRPAPAPTARFLPMLKASARIQKP